MNQITASGPRNAFTLLKTLAERYRTRQEAADFTGEPLLDLSIGNPDVAPDPYWRNRLQHFIHRDDLHGYGDCRSDINRHLCERFSAYFQRRFYPMMPRIARSAASCRRSARLQGRHFL